MAHAVRECKFGCAVRKKGKSRTWCSTSFSWTTLGWFSSFSSEISRSLRVKEMEHAACCGSDAGLELCDGEETSTR